MQGNLWDLKLKTQAIILRIIDRFRQDFHLAAMAFCGPRINSPEATLSAARLYLLLNRCRVNDRFLNPSLHR